ncbi:uncharacterized protein LOC126894557 isoform X2 [Daktulosphaira vitifoliae]|uniref:uncharacterized protein LOC126894557 isoform X2 n=1 Tax=Daktulosphaira vitifoliae TaxID=58002 RepID=UPI0021AA7863|nr:uncharacterized protein LOC126894557 isoform X2 [Daktulosphaira vitifoliae]
MFSKCMMLLCVSNLIKLILSNETIEYLTRVKMNDKTEMDYYAVKLNFKFKFNLVDKEWRKNKCESLGYTFKKDMPFVLPYFQTYKYQDLYKVLSDLICGDTKFSTSLQKNICSSINTNDDINKLFRDEESLNEYLNHNITFVNPVKAEECPICFNKPDVLVILNKCRHCLCKNCADTLLIRDENKCPLCRKDFSYYTDNVEGNVISSCSVVEYFAAAYYLDTCIFLYYNENKWMLFDKNGLKYSEEDMDGKKCIYLFLNKYNKTIGVIAETEELSNFRDNLY